MSGVQVGFARVNINPELGTPIAGYYVRRFARGFLDDLQVNTVAYALGDTRVLMVSIDSCGTHKPLADQLRQDICDATGVPVSHIFLHTTHSHTAAINNPDQLARNAEGDPSSIQGYNQVVRYVEFLRHRVVDSAVLALNDLKDATMGFIQGWAPERVAYIRRYKMKDGSTMTCPPINDPNIDHPIGELDQRVHVLRFDRVGGDTVVLVNYGLHADTVNGDLISSDWPGWMSRTVETVLEGTKCVYFNGAEGDVGSTHVFPEGGDMNDTEISFDNEMKSPGMARFVGRALAGTVLQVYDKVEYVPVDRLDVLQKVVTVPANVPKPEQLPLAHKYNDLHKAGRDDLIPYTAMELTTVVAEAARMCQLENGPYSFDLELTGIALGPVAMLGIPGEPFTDVGVQIKDTPGWKAIMPCSLTNGSMGYFPMRSAFDEGGYEARSSRYVSGVAEDIISGAKMLLNDLK